MGNIKSVDNWNVYEKFQKINYSNLNISEPNKNFILINNNIIIGKIITDSCSNITVKINKNYITFKHCHFANYVKFIEIKLRSSDYYGTLTIKQLDDNFLVRVQYSNYKKFPFYIPGTESVIINCILKK